MTLPNSDRAFGDFFSPVLNGSRVAFLASSETGAGIYLHDLATGELTVIADQNTPLPGKVGNFEVFGGGEFAIVALDVAAVTFLGGMSPMPPPPKGATGVYRHDFASGVITAVAEVGTNVPGVEEGQFDEFFMTISAHGGHAAFRYGDFIRTRGGDFFTPYYGVYSDLGGSLQKVLAQGDLLDGHTVFTAHIGPDALHSNQIAMLVTFEDTLPAIYLATLVPEPSTLLMLAFALIGVAGWQRVGRRAISMQPLATTTMRVGSDVPLPARATIGPKVRGYGLVLIIATLGQPASGLAQSTRFTFNHLVGQGSTTTNGNSLLSLYPPALDGGYVAFRADYEDSFGEFSGAGVFSIAPNASLAVLADERSPVPGTEGLFWNFGLFQSLDAGRVVFNAWTWPDGSGPIEGYYAVEGGIITTVVDTSVPLPSRDGSFTSLWNPNEGASADLGRVVFVGIGEEDVWGVYVSDASGLSRVVDTTMPIRNDSRSFRYFSAPVIAGQRVAFVAELDDFTQGIYLYDFESNSLIVAVDSNTRVPETGDTFDWFGSGFGSALDLDGDAVIFVGNSQVTGHQGIYRFNISTGALATIAAAGTPVPGVPGAEFGPYFQAVAADAGHVVFQYGAFISTRDDEYLTPHYGVYTDLSGMLEKLVGVDDELDQMIVSFAGRGDLQISSEAISGKQIAMLVSFQDFSQAIYLATLVPEPSTFALLLTIALGVWAWRRVNSLRSQSAHARGVLAGPVGTPPESNGCGSGGTRALL